jgi:hypothetical protein
MATEFESIHENCLRIEEAVKTVLAYSGDTDEERHKTFEGATLLCEEFNKVVAEHGDKVTVGQWVLASYAQLTALAHRIAKE